MFEVLANVSIVIWHVKTQCDSWKCTLQIWGQNSFVRITSLDIPQDLASLLTAGTASFVTLISQTSQGKDREMNKLQMSRLHKTSTSNANPILLLAICDKKCKGLLHKIHKNETSLQGDVKSSALSSLHRTYLLPFH